jgi:hypothetical protein
LNEQSLVHEFAEQLVREVRDRAIHMADAILRGQGPPDVVRRWADARSEGGEALATQVIADCVDEAIGCLLVAIDQELLPLIYRGRSGETVELAEVGARGLQGRTSPAVGGS